MVEFHDDFGSLLLVIAASESLCGIIKSKGPIFAANDSQQAILKRKDPTIIKEAIFFVFLFIETLCAVAQSTALVIAIQKYQYSFKEVFTGYATVITDGLCLVTEAFYT